MTLFRFVLWLILCVGLLLTARPDDVITQSFIVRADEYRATYAYAPAAEYARVATVRQPWNASLYLRLGSIAVNQHHFDEAQIQLALAGQYGADAAASAAVRAELAEQQNRFDEAAAQWQVVINTQPYNQAAIQNLIQAYANARNWDAARSAADAWLVCTPDSPQAQLTLAELIAVDDPAGAQDHLAYAPSEVAQLYRPVLNEPDHALRSELLGRVDLSQANLALAARAFADALAANPAYAEAYAYYGFTLDQLGEDGKSSLDQALVLDPNLSVARYFRARHESLHGDLDSALADLKAALDREPLNRVITAELGRVYLQRSEYASAEKWLTTARDLDPADPVGWKTLAELYAGHAYGSPAQAVSTALQAVTLAPKDATAHLWLGRAYLLSGDRDQAEDELRRSIELDPRSAVAHLYLGRLLTKSSDEGRLEFERAIGLDPDGPIGAQANRELQLP